MAQAVGPGSELTGLLEKLADPALPDEQRAQTRQGFPREQRPTVGVAGGVRRAGRPPSDPGDGRLVPDRRAGQSDRPIARKTGHRPQLQLADLLLRPSGRRGRNRGGPKPGEHVTGPHLSAVYRSQATGRWIVAISAPVYDLSPEPKFLGVAALMVEIGKFVDFQGDRPNQFATLVDNRDGREQRPDFAASPARKTPQRAERHFRGRDAGVSRRLDDGAGRSGAAGGLRRPARRRPRRTTGLAGRGGARPSVRSAGADRRRPGGCRPGVLRRVDRRDVGRAQGEPVALRRDGAGGDRGRDDRPVDVGDSHVRPRSGDADRPAGRAFGRCGRQRRHARVADGEGGDGRR